MFRDKIHVLFRQGVICQDSFVIVPKDPLSIDELHLGHRGFSRFYMQMGHVQSLVRNGIHHDLSVSVISYGADIGGLPSQADGIYRHIHRAPAGISLSVFEIAVVIHAVASYRGKLHSFSLLSNFTGAVRRMLEKRTLSGRATDLKNSTLVPF